MNSAEFELPSHLIIYDGICLLCDHSVQFILKRDTSEHYFFTPLQSDYAKSVIASLEITVDIQQTFLLIKHGKIYQRSDAALEICRDLSGLWPMFYGCRWLPKRVRDWCYSQIARRRYKLFGKKSVCSIPDGKTRSRFIQ